MATTDGCPGLADGPAAEIQQTPGETGTLVGQQQQQKPEQRLAESGEWHGFTTGQKGAQQVIPERLARDQIEGGKVHYTASAANRARHVEVGALIRFWQGQDEREVRVLEVSEQRKSAPLAQQLYEETEASLKKAGRKQRGTVRSPGRAGPAGPHYRHVVEAQNYPVQVQKLLGELLVATSLLTATLKFEGSITVQLQGNGPVRLAVINGDNNQQLRGVARYEGELPSDDKLQSLIGRRPAGHHHHPGAGSEQLATKLWIRTGYHQGEPRAAGILLQELPAQSEDHSDDFEHLTQLTSTIKDEELFGLEAEEILYRLYHQDKVRVFDPQAVEFRCTCSRARCEGALLQIEKEEVMEMVQELGKIDMHCDYCGAQYNLMGSTSKPCSAGLPKPTLAKQLGLDQYGIKNSTEILRNPSYDQLFAEETRADLEGSSAACACSWSTASAVPTRTPRLAVRIITEVAWQAHIREKTCSFRPSDEELKTFKPDFVVMNGAKCTNPNWKEQGLNSENFVAFNLTEKIQLIGGTSSADRDDEHGWDDDGVFNFEGGCYAKTIKLSQGSRAGHLQRHPSAMRCWRT
ncbi:UNVERIFIED_CONTAM: hypothetical protein K2H54_000286 [Gekko kuhli]